MTGKIRHLINRSGRYHARLVVPKDLQAIVGKTELRSPLGADYREALKLLPGAVTQLQHKIAVAERSAGQGLLISKKVQRCLRTCFFRSRFSDFFSK